MFTMSEPDQRNNLFERILIFPLPQELGARGGVVSYSTKIFLSPRSWRRGGGGVVSYSTKIFPPPGVGGEGGRVVSYSTKWKKGVKICYEEEI